MPLLDYQIVKRLRSRNLIQIGNPHRAGTERARYQALDSKLSGRRRLEEGTTIKDHVSQVGEELKRGVNS